jgi:hypothetical protein
MTDTTHWACPDCGATLNRVTARTHTCGAVIAPDAIRFARATPTESGYVAEYAPTPDGPWFRWVASSVTTDVNCYMVLNEPDASPARADDTEAK